MMEMNKDMLSQEEIDLLLKGTNQIDEDYTSDKVITEIEKDTLGEIGNISMGTAATTLSTLLNKKVLITTPQVAVTTTGELSYEYPIPFVAVDVSYKSGLKGSNILMINVDDVKIITNIMMGKDEMDTDRDLNELDLSAISEAMNQMMGSACTSLSEIFSTKIDIDPPKSYEITFSEGKEKLEVLQTSDPIIKISFRMVVEDLIDSELMQLIPLNFGRDIVQSLHGGTSSSVEETVDIEESVDATNIKEEDILENVLHNGDVRKNLEVEEEKREDVSKEHIVIKQPEFEAFDMGTDLSYNKPIDLVGDIPVELTVELGRTTKKISEILEYGQGTVIELDKLVGEPLNIYANGKYIAKGEVVVIDDNFGIRITNIDNSYGR